MYKYLIPIYWAPCVTVRGSEGRVLNEPLISLLIDSVSGSILSYSLKYGVQQFRSRKASLVVLREVLVCDTQRALGLSYLSAHLRPQVASYGLSLDMRMHFKSYSYDWYKAIMFFEHLFFDWDYEFLSSYRFDGKIYNHELLTLISSAVIKFNSAVGAGEIGVVFSSMRR